MKWGCFKLFPHVSSISISVPVWANCKICKPLTNPLDDQSQAANLWVFLGFEMVWSCLVNLLHIHPTTVSLQVFDLQSLAFYWLHLTGCLQKQIESGLHASVQLRISDDWCCIVLPRNTGGNIATSAPVSSLFKKLWAADWRDCSCAVLWH